MTSAAPGVSFADHARHSRDAPLWPLVGLVFAAVFLGGGGVAYGFRNLVIQLLALALLWWFRARAEAFLREAPRGLALLCVATLALPLLHLVPLPAMLWQALPGREPVIETLALARIEADGWRPLSLDRARTLTALAGLVAPAVLVVLGATLTRAGKARLTLAVAAAALAALLLGAVQLAAANSTALLFPIEPRPDVLYASFANRNSTALFFALAALLVAGAQLPRGRGWLLGAAAAGGLFVLAAVLTQSRSGVALLAPVLGFAILRAAWAWRSAGRAPRSPGPGRAGLAAGAVALCLAAALAASALGGGRAAASLERLGGLDTDRPQIWDDAAYAAQLYWPAGSGMGTFDEVFQLAESLEYVSARTAGRAHSDWLELAIEAGPAGLALALAWLGWAIVAAATAPPEGRWAVWSAALGAGLIALQSLLDYPLRNQTLLCLAAVLVVVMARPGIRSRA